ncbi:MAG: enoyl-CoA hydratase-related protein [Clostridiales bacterium]|nr:enoyl-CoA hydratase-related protein [Clostridiales bacterium]
MSYSCIKFEKKDLIGYVTINRPEALNSLNNDVINEVTDVFKKISDDDEVRVVILTGEGRAFVAGADIGNLLKQDAISGRAGAMKAQAMMDLIENIEKPVIAAVNGFALGGGCELAMACDMRIASDKAKFGQPEVNLGIIPCFGGTQRLSRLVGKGMAKYLIFSTEMIDAQEAFRIGLADRVVAHEELMPTVEALAKTIISKAPIAVKMAKASINNGVNLDLRSANQFEVEAYVSTLSTEDRVEGMTAFLEKRPSQFKNK